MNGKVYDLTRFADEHPGGKKVLVKVRVHDCGMRCCHSVGIGLTGGSHRLLERTHQNSLRNSIMHRCWKSMGRNCMWEI